MFSSFAAACEVACGVSSSSSYVDTSSSMVYISISSPSQSNNNSSLLSTGAADLWASFYLTPLVGIIILSSCFRFFGQQFSSVDFKSQSSLFPPIYILQILNSPRYHPIHWLPATFWILLRNPSRDWRGFRKASSSSHLLMAFGLFLSHCKVVQSLFPVHVCGIHFWALNASWYHLPGQIKIKLLTYRSSEKKRNSILKSWLIKEQFILKDFYCIVKPFVVTYDFNTVLSIEAISIVPII